MRRLAHRRPCTVRAVLLVGSLVLAAGGCSPASDEDGPGKPPADTKAASPRDSETTGETPARPAPPAPRTLPLREIGGGPTGGPDDPGTHVARHAAELQRLVPGSRIEEDVDFGEEMVLLVAAGQQPTGGYTVSIQRVEATGTGQNTRLRVEYRKRSPAPGSMVTTALTEPWHAVAVPRAPAGAKVEFVEVGG